MANIRDNIPSYMRTPNRMWVADDCGNAVDALWALALGPNLFRYILSSLSCPHLHTNVILKDPIQLSNSYVK